MYRLFQPNRELDAGDLDINKTRSLPSRRQRLETRNWVTARVPGLHLHFQVAYFFFFNLVCCYHLYLKMFFSEMCSLSGHWKGLLTYSTVISLTPVTIILTLWNLKDLRYTKESWFLVKKNLTIFFRMNIIKKRWEMGRMPRVIPQFDGPLLPLKLSIQMTGIWLTWLPLSPLPVLHMSNHWLTQKERKEATILMCAQHP